MRHELRTDHNSSHHHSNSLPSCEAFVTGFTFEQINITETMTDEAWSWANAWCLKTPISTKPTYWGQEMLMAKMGDGSVIKRIDMNAGTQSSLEYHVTKDEVYYLMSGELEIGVRVGRAENRSIMLFAGEQFSIPPGLCHMRIAKTDVVILEFANHDNTDDTHIVEDGKIYRHVPAFPNAH